jgi:L-tyrosine isonitrile synthase
MRGATLLNQKMSATGANAPAHKQSRPNGSAAVISPFRRTAEDGAATIHTGRPSKVALRHTPVAPEKVLQAFNTWAFKREQPDSIASLHHTIADAVRHARPVPFVLYWGKGPRCELAQPDSTCLDYLASLGARVRQAYAPGASFKLIFTDTHASLNGHAPEAMESYFHAVEGAARERGFDGCRLSQLVFAAEAAGAIDVADEHIPDEVMEKLGACAAKWFRGEGTVEEGAVRYLQMNMIEKRSVQFAFPRSIFVTFNGSEFRSLFPDRMPVFYMYSLRRGTSVKPWFLPAPHDPVLEPPAIVE